MLLSIDRLLGRRVAARHPDHGDVEGAVVGGFLGPETMGEVTVSALMLVVCCSRCGVLLVLPADNAVRVLPSSRPSSPVAVN